jgi:hypothetical protein
MADDIPRRPRAAAQFQINFNFSILKMAVIIPATRCSSVAASSGESVLRQPPKQSKWPMIFLDGLVLQPNFKSTSIF